MTNDLSYFLSTCIENGKTASDRFSFAEHSVVLDRVALRSEMTASVQNKKTANTEIVIFESAA